MGVFIYRHRDGSSEELDAEQLYERFAAPIRDIANPTFEQLWSYMDGPLHTLDNRLSKDNREGFEVHPDAAQLKEARERYMHDLDYSRERNRLPDGTMPRNWSEPSAETVDGTIQNMATRMAFDEWQNVRTRVDAVLDAAKERHEHYAENDAAAHGKEYAKALARLEAEEQQARQKESQKDVRTKLLEKVRRLPEERQRQMMAEFPTLFEE